MITRPLDLASRLRPEPRRMDWLFYVNGGLMVLFFGLFGSRFVLSPGLGAGFELPQAVGTMDGARPTTHVITVVNAGQIFVGDGVRNLEQLQEWLRAAARTEKQPSLLVRASGSVPSATIVQIVGLANAAGFTVTLAAEEPKGAAGPGQ